MEPQIELLAIIIKQTKERIKELQKELKDKASEYQYYGSSEISIERTEAVIAELIAQKIRFEKWRKLLIHTSKEQ